MDADERDVVILLVGDLDDEVTARLCGVLRALLRQEAVEVVTCDASGAGVDVRLVGALARLHVTARQLGGRIEIRGAGSELCLLVELVGLAGVLPVDAEGSPSGGEGR